MDQLSLNFGASPTVGPDGKPWVAIMVQPSAASNFTFGIPVEFATEFLKKFDEAVRAARDEAKRAASGLLVP